MEAGLFVGLSVFFLGILIGLPLCWVFLGSTFATLAIISGSTSFMAGTFYHAIDNYVLMAIAFFIFAGSLLSDSGHRRPDRPPLVRAGGTRPGRPGGRRDRGRCVHGRPDRVVAAGHRGADPAPGAPARKVWVPAALHGGSPLLVELSRVSHPAQRPGTALLPGGAAVRRRRVPVHRDSRPHPGLRLHPREHRASATDTCSPPRMSRCCPPLSGNR